MAAPQRGDLRAEAGRRGDYKSSNADRPRLQTTGNDSLPSGKPGGGPGNSRERGIEPPHRKVGQHGERHRLAGV